jgi:hypothetical protein
MGLDSVELIMEVEKEFALDIPDHDAVTLLTVGRLYDYVATHAPALPADARAGLFAGATWERYRDLVSAEIGVPVTALNPDLCWVQDLGLD